MSIFAGLSVQSNLSNLALSISRRPSYHNHISACPSLVEKLKAEGVGVECRGQLVSALLYMDDAVLFAEDEEGMRV